MNSRRCLLSHNIINVLNILLVSAVFAVCIFRSNMKQKNSRIQDIKDVAYPKLIQRMRDSDINRMKSVSYLDFATAGVFTDSIFSNFTEILHQNLFGNTHSESPSAEKSTNTIDDVRSMVFDYFDTKISFYTLIFTYSEAHALKVLAEAFPFTPQRKLLYSKRSNENILGIRGFASVSEPFDDGESSDPIVERKVEKNISETFGMVVMPLVDTFDGHVMTHKEISSVFSRYSNNNVIVADASLYLQTRKLSLKEYPFHAVTFSFEKLFGFPNIGGILVHNSLMEQLKRPYFGGGTLVYALTESDFEKLRLSPSDRFEDGSLPFLSIASIEAGFNFINQLGLNRVSRHVETLTEKLKEWLSDLRHLNGSPLVQIYGDGQSSIVTFNVLDKESNLVDYRTVVRAAASNDVYVVGGCHSTPGTCLQAMKIEESVIKENWNHYESIGAVRASVGWSSTENDVNRLISTLEKTFMT